MYLKHIPLQLKEGDKFIPYERKTGRRALFGGICTVKPDKTLTGKNVIPIRYGSDKKWLTVLAVDAQGFRRKFARKDGWGFIKVN